MSWLDNPLPTYEELAKLLQSSFRTCHSKGDINEYYVKVEFRTLEEAQLLNTYLAHIEHRGLTNAKKED